MQNYWWVTRPKRKLNTIPEELAAFCSSALGKKWAKNRATHIAFEEELESSGTKRIGERRDATGSGGRTHAAMLYSLGLWFEKNEQVFLTLAGEAILEGQSPVEILKKQVLRFQYPSPYSVQVRVSPDFKIRPFPFLLRLLTDERIGALTQEEIAKIVQIEAKNETNSCYERVASRILEYRANGDAIFPNGYFEELDASIPNLMDVANTIMNWLDYTQLVFREKKLIGADPDKIDEVLAILRNPAPFIQFPCEADVFQRKYGVDPKHQKDTRNLLNTASITTRMIEKNRILRAFFNYSSLNPVISIGSDVIDEISQLTGTDKGYTEDVLLRTYPNGALNGYLSNYRSMAFQGRDEATDFEIATTNLFRDVFDYEAIHLGQTGALSAPDVLLISDSDGYQAIIDNKAYSKYSISGDHHNRMVHNYIENIGRYSECRHPIGFFTYISGGFVEHIDRQIKSVADDSGVHGSGITVATLISLIEEQMKIPYSHEELRGIFGLDRQIRLSDMR